MFFKMNVLKKMMKNAYKGRCLIVGNSTVGETEEQEGMEGYVISSGWWSLWIMKEHTPKELKAAVMELCGEIPYEGRWFKATESMGNQEMIPFTDELHPAHLFATSKKPVSVTKLLMITNQSKVARILQCEEGGEVSAINEMIIDLIDPKAIDEEAGVYAPIGPVTKDNSCFSWGNNVCYFNVWPIILLNEEKEAERKQFYNELGAMFLPI